MRYRNYCYLYFLDGETEAQKVKENNQRLRLDTRKVGIWDMNNKGGLASVSCGFFFSRQDFFWYLLLLLFVVLTVLELGLYSRIISKLEIHLPLPLANARIKCVDHHAQISVLCF